MEEEKKETKQDIFTKVNEEVERIIKTITENGLQTANVDLLYKLIDIHKDIKNEEYWKEKEENIMYRDYYSGGRSRDSKGRYMDSYGRRGRNHYRGYDMIDEMGRYYGDYVDGHEKYGNDNETEKSFDKMLECFEGFAYSIMEETNEPDKIDKIRRIAKRISDM